MLAYWLSYFVFTGSLEYRLNNYVFHLAIILAKGERLALLPLYLGSLFDSLDKCANNVVWSVGRYDVATYFEASCLEIFIWKRFGALAPKSVGSIM